MKDLDATIQKKDGEIRQLHKDKTALEHAAADKDRELVKLRQARDQVVNEKQQSDVEVQRLTRELRQSQTASVSNARTVPASSPVQMRLDMFRPQVHAGQPIRDDSDDSDDDDHDHRQPAHDTSGYKDMAALHFMHLLARLRALTEDNHEDRFIDNLVRIFEGYIRKPSDRLALLQKLPPRIVVDGDFHASLYHYLLSDDGVNASSRRRTSRRGQASV